MITIAQAALLTALFSLTLHAREDGKSSSPDLPGTDPKVVADVRKALDRRDERLFDSCLNGLEPGPYWEVDLIPLIMEGMTHSYHPIRMFAGRHFARFTGIRPEAVISVAPWENASDEERRRGMEKINAWWNRTKSGSRMELLLKVLGSDDLGARREAFDRLSGMFSETFDYNPEDAPDRRSAAIDRWKEFWNTNKGVIVYDTEKGFYRPGNEKDGQQTVPDAEQVNEYIRQLGDEDWNVRDAATKKLIGMGGMIIPLIKEALGSSDLEVRYRAGTILAEVVAPTVEGRLRDIIARKATAELRPLAGQKDVESAKTLVEFVRMMPDWDSCHLLRDRLKQDKTYAVPLAVKLFRSSDQSVVYYACEAFQDFANDLVPYLRDPVPTTRLHVLEAIMRGYYRGGRISASPELIKESLRLLADGDPRVRTASANVLSSIGDRNAIPEIEKLLKDREMSVRRWAAVALGKFKDPTVIPVLVNLVADASEHSFVRGSAAEAVSAVGDLQGARELWGLLERSRVTDNYTRAYVVQSIVDLCLENLQQQEGLREGLRLFEKTIGAGKDCGKTALGRILTYVQSPANAAKVKTSGAALKEIIQPIAGGQDAELATIAGQILDRLNK